MGAAFSQDRVYLGRGVYEWRYKLNFSEDVRYKVVLVGAYTSREDQVEWTMTISEQGNFNDFVWLEGTMLPNQSSFTIYGNPEQPTAHLLIDYSSNPNAENEGATRFTNVNPDDPNPGSYIEYKSVPTAPYNIQYIMFWNSEDVLEIQSNTPAGNGRVRRFQQYGDNEWRCWNERKNDVAC